MTLHDEPRKVQDVVLSLKDFARLATAVSTDWVLNGLGDNGCGLNGFKHVADT